MPPGHITWDLALDATFEEKTAENRRSDTCAFPAIGGDSIRTAGFCDRGRYVPAGNRPGSGEY